MGHAYQRKRDLYKDLTRRLQSLITDLLAGEGLEVIQIEARTKNVDSFIEKITRKGTKYKDLLAEITDLAGIRIITYYLEDVGRVGDILKGEFEVDKTNSVDKSWALDPTSSATPRCTTSSACRPTARGSPSGGTSGISARRSRSGPRCSTPGQR